MDVTRCLRTHVEKWCRIERVIRWIWYNWEIQRFEAFSSLWMWLFHRLRYSNGTVDERSTASVPSSSISLIQILLRLCLTLVLLTKTLRHHPLRDFVSALYNYTQPLEFCTFLICTWKRLALISQNHRFPSHNRHVSTLSCTSCGGVGNEAVIGRAPLLARKTFHGNICTSGLRFWKWRAVDGGRDDWVA